MRTKIILFVCSLITLTSCNNDDDNTQNPDTGLTLHKTVKFTPTEEAYNTHSEGSTKSVKYYENNRVVADTLYNQNGELESWSNHMYATNSHIATSTNLNYPGAVSTTEHTYDNNGRIIQEKRTYQLNGAISSVDVKAFTYTNNKVTLTYPLSNTNSDIYEYLLNPNGLIYLFKGGSDYQMEINYDPHGKPLSYGPSYDNETAIWTTSATYYDNISMPAGQIKTLNQINNSILTNGIENIFLECNYHCKAINSNITFEKTFDASGNVLHCKQTSPYVQIYPSAETFYYYN